MRALGWIPGRLRRTFTARRDGRTRRAALKKIRPRVETLEAISLLSSGIAAAQVSPLDSTITQTLSTSAQTNVTGQPFSPPLQLFNSSLGTLTSVSISESVNFSSHFTFQNFSTESPSTVTNALTNATYAISNLPGAPLSGTATGSVAGPITVPVAPSAGTPSSISFDVPASDSKTVTLTDAASLAQYTASSTTATIAPLMTANAVSTASATGGNSTFTVVTSLAATATITYTYTPGCSINGLVRFGVHHQQTQLIVSFTGTVDPTLANNPSNYTVITSSGKTVPIAKATFNATTNSVTLIPAIRLNVHHHFVLQVKLPCANGMTVTVPFGGKASLSGFTGEHHKHSFKLVNGRLVQVS